MKYFETTKYKYEVAVEERVHTNIIPPVPIDQPDFAITADGVVIAKVGYMWDGPSGPTFDTPDFMTGSLVHDILAEAMRQGLLPESFWILANKELVRICKEKGMSKIRATWVYWGVCLTNNWCRRTTKPEHPILEAP